MEWLQRGDCSEGSMSCQEEVQSDGLLWCVWQQCTTWSTLYIYNYTTISIKCFPIFIWAKILQSEINPEETKVALSAHFSHLEAAADTFKPVKESGGKQRESWGSLFFNCSFSGRIEEREKKKERGCETRAWRNQGLNDEDSSRYPLWCVTSCLMFLVIFKMYEAFIRLRSLAALINALITKIDVFPPAVLTWQMRSINIQWVWIFIKGGINRNMSESIKSFIG